MNPLVPLISALKRLPGVGEKSAQRIAFFLLSVPEREVEHIASSMVHTRKAVKYCSVCFNISFEQQCHVCRDDTRIKDNLCIVAEPKDVFAIERTGAYKGMYHVLGGLISPLDGIQPESLRIKELVERLRQTTFTEVFFAINPTVEGDTTVMYISSILAPFKLNLTKLAFGLPMGSDIDYADEITLTKAISARREIDE